MSFFIDYTNVRPGNRGGRDQFKWEDVTLKSYKDREMYLGGATKMGFLSSGGKWRKKDWWHSYNPEGKRPDKDELDRFKQEELDLIYEAAGSKRDKNAPKAPTNKESLTNFEYNELMKKEAKFTPDDAKLFEFYENDDKKRGLGMKPQVSYRTNPYANDVVSNMQTLEGFNYEDKDKLDGGEGGINSNINEEVDGKIKSVSPSDKKLKHWSKSRSRSRNRLSRSRSRSRDKEKKHKSKKHKKEKSKHKEKHKDKHRDKDDDKKHKKDKRDKYYD